MINMLGAFQRPFSEPKRFALQALISISPLSLFAFPIAWGYLFRCMQSTIEGEETLPEWPGIVMLLVNGLASVGVVAIYLLPGIIFFVFSFPSRNPFDPTEVPIISLLILALIFLIAGLYIMSAGFLHAAKEHDWAHAFFLKEVIQTTFTLPYLIATGASILLSLFMYGLFLLQSRLNFMPPLMGTIVFSIILGIFGAYAGIVIMTLYGQAYPEEEG